MPKPRYCKNCGSVDIKINKVTVLCRDCGFCDLLRTDCELGCNPKTEDEITITVARVPRTLHFYTLFGEIKFGLN